MCHSIKSPLDSCISLVPGIKFIWIAADILFLTVLNTYRNIKNNYNLRKIYGGGRLKNAGFFFSVSH